MALVTFTRWKLVINVKPDHKNKKRKRKIHGTDFFHLKFLGCPYNKCQNGPVLPPAQVFYFNCQALTRKTLVLRENSSRWRYKYTTYSQSI
jgi:hypothetical protein